MPIRIIIADDHAVFRSALRVLLEKEADFEIVGESGSGMDTIRIVAGKACDVLVLDISMPGMTGTTAAKEILKKDPKLSILALTMHDDEHYVRELFSIGVRGYMLKTSPGNELVQAIQALYRGDSYLDPALVDLVISPFTGRPPVRKQQGRLGLLTSREQEVCSLLAHGYSHAKAAEKLNISPRTIETHRAHIMSKLGFSTRADLIHFAMENGLLEVR